ncbi:MAG: MMPL family transporter [Pseudomonadota bacterium]|nr:MAG: MMPL family transporter [Pseudomonadota bacterium]
MGEQLNQWTLRYADWVIRHRWLVIVTTLIVVVLAASGGRHLGFSNNYRVFFSQENPELTAFEEFQKTYTKNDNILFVLQPSDGRVFTPAMADAVEWLTAQSWKIPYAIRVDSFSNFQHSWAAGDELTVEDLVRDATTLSTAELERREAVALAEPLLRGNLLSPTADTTGINVTIQYPEIDNMKEVPEAVAFARQLASELRERHPDVTVVLSGISMLNNAFAEAGQTDAQTLVPLMYALLIVAMAIALRSLAGTVTTVLIIGLSTATAMGLAGHLGIKLTPVSVTAPTIILTLAIADSVHLLVTMLTLMREGRGKHEALKESVRVNFIPVSITSLTTIVGFLALNFSDAPPFWHLGNITAMGIAAAWALSLAFLPAVISLLPLRVTARRTLLGGIERRLSQLAEVVIAQRRPILIGMGAAALGLMALAPTIVLNDQFVRYFDHRVQFRNDADFATENLTGVYVVEYSLAGREAGGISEPTYLANLERFTRWLREQPEVTHVYSYSDIIKRLNKNMHGDDPAWYDVPEDRELAAQYLLLYELSLPFGLDLNDRISVDKSATRVSVTLQEISTAEIRAFLERSTQWLAVNTPDYMHTRPTSASVMFSYISQRNIESMLRGNAVAVALIAAIMILMLRSVGLGLLSLIPNTVPILMTFGIWALLVGQVGMAAATVTATSLGIVVDDTVHFLSKYLRARRERGLDRADAIRYAFRTVGTAIVVTTVVLTVGFGVLAGSTFLINSQLGLLTALAVVLAMVVDFLLLPALLLVGYQTEKETHHELEQIGQPA